MSASSGDTILAGVTDAPSQGGDAAKDPEASDTKTPGAKRHRRPFSNVVLHAPQVLRALVRTDEIWLVVLAAFVGFFTGCAVWLMTVATQRNMRGIFPAFGASHPQASPCTTLGLR